MADSVITNVTTVDIQMLNAERGSATTIKLDNPKDNITREQVSAAMQPALSAGWFLCTDDSPATYLGNITVNQSIKTKLGGEDFYITPSSLSLSAQVDQIATGTVNCSGATIQGINIDNIVGFDEHPEDYVEFLSPVIAANGLSAQIKVKVIGSMDGDTISFKVKVIVQGIVVTIPATVTASA